MRRICQAQSSFKRRPALFAIEAARVLDVAAAFVGCNLRIGAKRPRAVGPRHVRRLARFRGDHVGRDTPLDPGIQGGNCVERICGGAASAIRSSLQLEDDGAQSITSRLWPHSLRVQMLRRKCRAWAQKRLREKSEVAALRRDVCFAPKGGPLDGIPGGPLMPTGDIALSSP